MATKIAIHGAAGRMGQRLIALGVADPNVEIVGALDSSTHPSTGVDAGIVAGVGEIGILVGSEMPTQVDAVIDFSVPTAAVAIGKACLQHEVPVVLATTGLTEQEQEQLDHERDQKNQQRKVRRVRAHHDVCGVELELL